MVIEKLHETQPIQALKPRALYGLLSIYSLLNSPILAEIVTLGIPGRSKVQGF